MEFNSRKHGKHAVVSLHGRLDISQADEVEVKLSKELQGGDGDIIINLHDISYISSSGIRVFVGTVREMERLGRKLRLCAITPPVKKVFDVVELLDLFEVYDTEEEAVASLPA